MKGFSLIELMIVMVIFSVLLGAIYGTMSMSTTSFKTGDVQVVVQQEARKSMDKLVTELREASSVNITAEYPFTIWGNKIKYETNNGQLQKVVEGGAATVLANDVSNIQFTLLGGNILRITLTAQKNTIFGRTLSATLTSQVTLRN